MRLLLALALLLAGCRNAARDYEHDHDHDRDRASLSDDDCDFVRDLLRADDGFDPPPTQPAAAPRRL